MVQILMMLPWSRHGEKVVAACCRVKSAGSPEAKLRRFVRGNYCPCSFESQVTLYILLF